LITDISKRFGISKAKKLYDYCLCSKIYGIISQNNWLNGAWRCSKQHSA
jgi:hypothetical protein